MRTFVGHIWTLQRGPAIKEGKNCKGKSVSAPFSFDAKGEIEFGALVEACPVN